MIIVTEKSDRNSVFGYVKQKDVFYPNRSTRCHKYDLFHTSAVQVDLRVMNYLTLPEHGIRKKSMGIISMSLSKTSSALGLNYCCLTFRNATQKKVYRLTYLKPNSIALRQGNSLAIVLLQGPCRSINLNETGFHYCSHCCNFFR